MNEQAPETPDPREELLQEEPTPVTIEPAQEERQPETGFTNDHYGMGQMMGLSPEQVDAFNDPAVFENVARTAISHNNQRSQQPVPNPGVSPDGRQINYNSTQRPNPDQQKAYAEQMNKAVEEHVKSRSYGFGDADEFDDSIVEMNEHYADRVGRMELAIHQLAQQNQSLVQQEQSRQADAVSREFDRVCDALSEEEFGRGPIGDLPREQAMARYRLADQVSQAGHSYIDRREMVPSLDHLVREVTDTSLKSARSQVLRDISEQSKQASFSSTAEPSHSGGEAVAGTDAAEKAVAEYYRDHGVPGGGSGDELL